MTEKTPVELFRQFLEENDLAWALVAVSKSGAPVPIDDVLTPGFQVVLHIEKKYDK